jgi:spore coat polysaccharide biosynthesis protein SpsF
VAISTDPSDDHLFQALTGYKCTVVRGSLQDVLSRFAQAIEAFPDETIVVRLTGDNLLPDGTFITELIDFFELSGCDYLDTAFPQSKMPYGISGEAFRAKSLREANRNCTSPYDREHVTPWIRRRGVSRMFVPALGGQKDFSHLRCTVDDREDYERILRLFDGVDHPLTVSWQELVNRLNGLPGEPAFRIAYRVVGEQAQGEMTLGTAQLGMNYGIANLTGKPNEEEAVQIVRTALTHGVTTIDTARAYEESEHVIGKALSGAWRSRAEVITKLDLPDLDSSAASPAAKREMVDASVRRSLQELQAARLPVLLLHSWKHHEAWDGIVWSRLRGLRDEGLIGALGASVYEPEEALAALNDPAILYLQIPFNILDWRWHAAGMPQALQRRPDVIVHARSALLQGLLMLPGERWPSVHGFSPAPCIERLRQFIQSFGRESVHDLCFAYVRSQPWIHSVVVGCDSLTQLREDLSLFRRSKLTKEQCCKLHAAFSDIPPMLLNPTKWRV